MALAIGPETKRLIEKAILRRFEDYRDEEIQAALQAVADDFEAQGMEGITYRVIYQVYVNVMSY